IRQDDRHVLGDVVAQPDRIVVVVVDVGEVEVGRVPDRRGVDPGVVGEGEPGGEVGRVEPGIAEDAAVLRLDVETGMPDERDPQPNASSIPTSAPFGTPVSVVVPCRRDNAPTGLATMTRCAASRAGRGSRWSNASIASTCNSPST